VRVKCSKTARSTSRKDGSDTVFMNKKFKVKGIPSLVVLGPDGELITTDGRAKVMEHFDDCAGYPWAPKPLSELLAGPFLRKDDTTVELRMAC